MNDPDNDLVWIPYPRYGSRAVPRWTHLFKIRWWGFGRTAHWLKGTAFVEYVMHEDLLPVVIDEIYTPNPILERLKK